MTMIGYDGQKEVKLPAEVYDEAQWKTYFDLIAQGIGPDLAARDLGTTGTKMRTLIKRDPDYVQRFQQAREEGRAHYEERLRSQARLRALDPERPSDRILEVELATHVEGYEHLRRDRMKIDAHVSGLVIELDGQSFQEYLDRLPLDEKKQLREMMDRFGVRMIGPEHPDIEAAS